MRNINRGLALVSLFSVSVSFAAALADTDIAGKYKEEGIDEDGKAYAGELVVAKKGDTWTLKSEDGFTGVGIMVGDVVAFNYKKKAEDGVIVYKIEKGDKGPKLTGKWSPTSGDGKIYGETLTFQSK